LKLKTSSLLIAGALFGAAVLPAQASNEAMMDLLKVLRDQGTITAENYELLSNAAKADKEATVATEAKVEKVAKKANEATTVSMKGGHLKVKSADGDFSAQIGGRIMADAAYFDGNDDSESGSEIRRARLFMSGTAYKDWGYKAQFDFAGSKVSMKDMYLQYKGWKPAKFTVGNHKMPLGLEQQTSSKYITFMERSILADVQEDTGEAGRAMGISSFSHGDNWTAAVAAHLEGTSKGFGNGEDEDWGYGGRVTFAPIAEKTKNIHLGIAYHHQEYKNDGRGIDGEFRPEAHLSPVKPFVTGDLGLMNDGDAWGLEAATVWGPFSAQAEYTTADLTSASGNTLSNDPDVDTWYVYGSWFITGESRAYKADKGAFGRVKPNSNVGHGGMGAWEVGLRYSDADLENDDLGNNGNVTTLGLNWYATPTIRFMANYSWVDVDNGNRIGEEDVDGNILQMRGQIDF